MDLRDRELYQRVFLENKIQFKPQVVVVSGHSRGTCRSESGDQVTMHSTSLTEITPVSTRRSNYGDWGAVIGGGMWVGG